MVNDLLVARALKDLLAGQELALYRLQKSRFPFRGEQVFMSSRDAPIFSRDSRAERKDRNVEARHKKLFPTESRTGVYV